METISLSAYLVGLTQEQAAMRLGVSQGALSQMLSSDRKIFVQLINGDVHNVYEIKPVGLKRKK